MKLKGQLNPPLANTNPDPKPYLVAQIDAFALRTRHRDTGSRPIDIRSRVRRLDPDEAFGPKTLDQG